MRLLNFLLLLFCTTFLHAQNLKHWNLPFTLANGTTLKFANAGGLNTPQFSEIDLNNDGIEDLLVYDRSAQKALPFLNLGTANQVAYEYAPQFEAQLPQNTRNFMLARDYDGDGIKDLFFFNQPPATSGGIGVMKGSYNLDNQIEFTLVEDILSAEHPIFGSFYIFIFNPDVPGIADVDGDGDLDIAAFNLDFTFQRNVYYYKNMSVENGFGQDSLIFDLFHECHGMFSESGSNNTALLSPGVDSCADNNYWGNRTLPATPHHVGSSVTLIDWNKDGAMDLVMGDVGANTLNMLSANLVNDTILMIEQDTTYPFYDVPADVFSFPSAYFLDVDNDGLEDMITAPTELSLGEAVTDSVAWFYKNTKVDSIWLSYQQKNFLVGEMIDLGMGAHPAIVDVDNDGLLDLVVGHFGFTDSLNFTRSQLTYYRNVGTSSAPAFQVADVNFAGLDTVSGTAFYPNFGDLDGDGDLDMILGRGDGSISYLENTAAAGSPMSFTSIQHNYAFINLNVNAAPQLIDIDRDGDLDIMAGNGIGRLYYFENKGTATTPAFLSTATSSTFGFDLSSYGGNEAVPHFVDTGSDFELFLGTSLGPILHFNNIDGNVTGIYDTLSLDFENLWVGRHSTIAVADLDGDDTLDYVMGNIRGGLSFYNVKATYDTLVISNQLVTAPQQSQVTIYPNPTQGILHIRWNDVPTQVQNLRIYDALGRLHYEQQHPAGQQQAILHLEGHPSGIYFLQMSNLKGNYLVKPIRID